ncbi:MAG: NYN domain-containing protein [Deferribacteres bacterium]|nr:NYN domain-containing protein [Deferribacteres bacterium]
MAYILIDGYNLIGIAHGDLEKARNDLIQKLLKYSEIKKHHITLVFDGWKNGQPNETKTTTKGLTVIYSRLGEKADLTIRRILSSSTKPWIVVSTDREVSGYATGRDFAAVRSDEFEYKLYSALKGTAGDPTADLQNGGERYLKCDADEGEYPPAGRKGNPRKPSRRQKKKLQALKKL